MLIDLSNFEKVDFRLAVTELVEGEPSARVDYLYKANLPGCNCGLDHYVRICTLVNKRTGEATGFAFKSDGNGSLTPESILRPIDVYSTANVLAILNQMVDTWNSHEDMERMAAMPMPSGLQLDDLL